jgi:hypothetical protein
MIIKGMNITKVTGHQTVAVRCPGCGHQGTFQSLDVSDLHIQPDILIGIRKCPGDGCKTVLYFVKRNNQLVETFPALRIDFDRTNIPDRILSALEEAITCHSTQCYVASAIMIRKALDLLCQHRGATGANLKDRIASLGTKVLIPKELLDGMDDLRLLGNDAAHIESQVFDDVGKEEVEVGIEFAKEILKAVYQYSALLSKLKSLKKAP